MNARLAGRYQIVRELGAGAMGRVFLATDLQMQRPVAAKVLLAGAHIDLQALLRFQQEGAVLSTLKHPNIVEVYSTFLEGETSCIIMEFLQGEPLGATLRRQGSLPLWRVKHIGQQVLAALAYAHSHGIVHRDIKPDNIMLLQSDFVKVTDFGIARILQEGSTLATRTGTTVGTPLYMSPEQVEGARIDGRADLYSVGAVLFQMVTGRPPFEGGDPITIAFKHVHSPPPRPTQLNAAIPRDWEDLVLRALAKDPAQRYQTADAMLAAVSALGAEGPPRRSIPLDPPPARPTDYRPVQPSPHSIPSAHPTLSDTPPFAPPPQSRVPWQGAPPGWQAPGPPPWQQPPPLGPARARGPWPIIAGIVGSLVLLGIIAAVVFAATTHHTAGPTATATPIPNRATAAPTTGTGSGASSTQSSSPSAGFSDLTSALLSVSQAGAYSKDDSQTFSQYTSKMQLVTSGGYCTTPASLTSSMFVQGGIALVYSDNNNYLVECAYLLRTANDARTVYQSVAGALSGSGTSMSVSQIGAESLALAETSSGATIKAIIFRHSNAFVKMAYHSNGGIALSDSQVGALAQTIDSGLQ